MLGAEPVEVGFSGYTDLRTRIEERLEANRELHAANAELADDNHKLRAQLTEAQGDLIAVRAKPAPK